MPNNLENNDSIIKKIVIENNGTYDQANIGTSAEYVDYNNASVADTLDNIQQQLTRVIQQLTNNTEQIAEMDETVGNARKAINKINSMKNQIEHLSQDIGDEVQKNINNTTFFTKDIIWQDNLERTLRSVLGNLINLPLQATNLRDWIEKISAMGGNGGSSPGGGGGGGGSGGLSVMPIGSTPATISVSRLFHSDNATGLYHSPEIELLTDEQKNISNWQKNMQSFPQFDNTYTNGRNRLAYTGGSGYERIYLPVDLTGSGIFSFDMRCPMNGYNCDYGSDTDYAFISKSMPDSGSYSLQLNNQNIVAYAALPKTSSNTYTRIEMNVNTPGTYYFGIDFGYIVDGVPITIDISNISCICIQNYYYNYSQEVN